MQPDRAAEISDEHLLAKAALRAAGRLRLSQTDLSRIIGVSKSVVSGMAKGDGLPASPKVRELIVLFIRLYRSLDALMGGDETVAAAWLKGPNAALGGRPVDRIMTIEGLTHTLAYLDSRRAIV